MNRKKLLWIILLCLIIVVTAYAVGKKLTLDSAKPMPKQIEAFQEWYNSLSVSDQFLWDEWFQQKQQFIGQADTQSLALAAVKPQAAEQMVWIPKSGTKYHRTATCSNMNNPTKVTKSTAISRGYAPCKKCKP